MPHGRKFDRIENSLRYWAILGPFVGAIASAFWARYTLSKDRKYEQEQELNREDRKIRLTFLERAENHKKDKYNEIKMR